MELAVSGKSKTKDNKITACTLANFLGPKLKSKKRKELQLWTQVEPSILQ